MTAGVAAAEVTFSGAAAIALVDDNGAYAAATHTTYSLAEAELRAEAALADARDAKDALVNPTATRTTAADKAIEAAEKALEKLQTKQTVALQQQTQQHVKQQATCVSLHTTT